MVHPPFKMALDATSKTDDDDWRDADTPAFFAAEWRLCMLLALVIALELSATRRPNKSENPISKAAPTPNNAPITER